MDDRPSRNRKSQTCVSLGRPRTAAPSLPKLIPTDGLSVEKQVYLALRHALMNGAMMPGAALTSRSLSEAIGTSPTPVREALKRLDADSALVSRSRSAFYVNDPNQTDFAEILEIRLMLEGKAIRRAAERATRESLEPIRKLNREYNRIGRIGHDGLAESLRINFRLHFEIYNLAGSAQLVKMIEALWLRIGPALHHYIPDQGADDIGNFHNQMIDALVNGDADAAEKAVILDLTTASDAIIPLLKPAPVSQSKER